MTLIWKAFKSENYTFKSWFPFDFCTFSIRLWSEIFYWCKDASDSPLIYAPPNTGSNVELKWESVFMYRILKSRHWARCSQSHDSFMRRKLWLNNAIGSPISQKYYTMYRSSLEFQVDWCHVRSKIPLYTDPNIRKTSQVFELFWP